MESGNGGNGGNIGGRFGRDGMRFGLNGKEMEWNMVHDKAPEYICCRSNFCSCSPAPIFFIGGNHEG